MSIRRALRHPFFNTRLSVGGGVTLICARCKDPICKPLVGTYHGKMAHLECADFWWQVGARLRWALHVRARYLWLPWHRWRSPYTTSVFNNRMTRSTDTVS